MRYSPYIILTVFLLCGFSISICKPAFFSENAFLDQFVNHEFINLMAVIVTVSLVSVVQLHMEYTRIERKFKQRAFEKSRRTVNANGVILIALFVFSFIISFIKGMPEVEGNLEIQSMVHVVALAAILECAWIMYELIRTAYTIARTEPIDGSANTES